MLTEYGQLRDDLKSARLADLCVDKRVQTGPFGTQLHAEDYAKEGTPIITVEHLGENRILHEDLPRVRPEDQARLARYRMRVDDIIFSRVGSVDSRALVRDEEDGWLFSGRCLRMRPDARRIDPAYLSWFLGLPGFRRHMRSIAVGATMPSLNTRLLGSVRVYFPPLDDQRRIASILGALDDKIELDRRMSRTLEDATVTLFKSLAANSRWPDGPLYDLCDVVYGAPFKSDRFSDEPRGTGIIRIRDIATHATSVYTDEQHPRACVIHAGDIVVGMDGEFLVEHWMGDDALLNQRVCHLRPRPGVPRALLALVARERIRFFERAKTGTTVVHLGKSDLDTVRVPTPDGRAIEAFGAVAEPCLQRRIALARESRALVQVRDTLLPRLLDGSLEVPDA